MTEPIRVLQVVASLNAGGMENYIMNLYRMVDKSKVQFDFVVHHAAVGLYEDEIHELGGKIYHFTVLDDKNVVKYISELNRFFDEHKEYQIIHGHLSSLAVFYLGVAKKYNVPWRIAHSHGAGFLHTLKGTAKYLLFRTTKWNANVRLACSTEAGKYLYGKDTFEFVPNGIDVDRFTFDENKRIEMRKMLGIRDEYVIGHGRHIEQRRTSGALPGGGHDQPENGHIPIREEAHGVAAQSGDQHVQHALVVGAEKEGQNQQRSDGGQDAGHAHGDPEKTAAARDLCGDGRYEHRHQ